jgi:tetratricopeptide (TPR) repeat protein
MTRLPLMTFLAALSLMTAGCATTSSLARLECYNPDRQLMVALQQLEARRVAGCGAGGTIGGAAECERYRREIERLAVVCSTHIPTLMANAVIAYDDRQLPKAQQFLDRIFSEPRSNPDAAVLRARIAIDEGNLSFARRLLEQQIKLAPDHAGLHETYGGVLYLDGQITEARRELTTADALGAPRWRVAYHLGLVEEAAGNLEAARKYYNEAIAASQDYAQARSRLRGLEGTRKVP